DWRRRGREARLPTRRSCRSSRHCAGRAGEPVGRIRMAVARSKQTPGNAAAAVARREGDKHKATAETAKAKKARIKKDAKDVYQKGALKAGTVAVPEQAKTFLEAAEALARGNADPRFLTAILKGVKAAFEAGTKLGEQDAIEQAAITAMDYYLKAAAS